MYPWICPYLWGIAYLSAVVAQDAFPVSFTASPPSNVAPGTTLNLTCSFKLVKDNLLYVKFTNDGGKEFFEFIQEGANPPSWLQFGQKLSNDPEVNSVVWVTFAATFCNATSLQKKYGCAPSNNQYEFASAETIVTLAGPSKELSVNRMKICGSTLESDVINKTQRINVSISNERNQVTDLTLKIDGKPVGSATPKNRNDVCAYGSEILTDYKFTASQEYQLEYSYTSSGNQVTESCKITVKGSVGLSPGGIVVTVMALYAVLCAVIGSVYGLLVQWKKVKPVCLANEKKNKSLASKRRMLAAKSI